ncbi:MAG: L,D-transpeptidase family protein, partial [Anaerolineae bacterium]|nr:L,D-transpeptidase family protein [Anaerolineae bacterium]
GASMTTHDHTQTNRSKLGRINAILSLVLVTAVAAFVLSFAAKVGYDLVTALAPEVADAAPEEQAAAPLQPAPDQQPAPTQETETAAPSLEETPAPPTPAATTVPPTPTATVAPTATPEPTPVPPTPVPATPRLVTGENRVNVRRGPGTGYETTGQLEPGSEVRVLAWSGDWWQILYEGQIGYVYGELVTAYDVDKVPEVPASDLPGPTVDNPIFEPAPTWAIDEDRWIDVDLSEQRVTAYEGRTPVKTYLVSTGLPGTPTPVGQFRIYVKFRYDDMEGADYYLEDVPFVMYFYQGYGFHGVWWHANWGNPMSHGCINQPNEMAEWLFGFADVGTLVNIHD